MIVATRMTSGISATSGCMLPRSKSMQAEKISTRSSSWHALLSQAVIALTVAHSGSSCSAPRSVQG